MAEVKLRVEIGDNEIQTCIYAPLITNQNRVTNGPRLEAGTRPEPELISPNPTQHSFSKPDLGSKAKFTQ